jgi:hypothetical protein
VKTRTLQAHPEVAAPLDGASESDRQWFHSHAGMVRLRPQLPDEMAAMAAVATAGGHGPLPRMGATVQGQELPPAWMVVVDVLRLAGLPHGPDGESGRAKFACPEPLDAAMAEEIAAMALATVRASFPAMPRPPAKHRRRDRGNRRGFGR